MDDIHLFVSDTYFDPENRVLTSLAESLAGSAGRPFAADLSVGDQMLVPAHVDQNFDSTIGRLGTPLRGYQQGIFSGGQMQAKPRKCVSLDEHETTHVELRRAG